MNKTVALAAVLMAGIFSSAHAQSDSLEENLAIGDQVSGELFGQLMSVLQTKIASDGAEAAIAYCRLEALPVTKEVGLNFPQIKSLRRTAIRTRNPANKPDTTDRRVLEDWHRAWSPRSPPKPVMLEVDLEDGRREIRYYRPVLTMTTCLACHGSPADLSAGVKAALRRDYPEDEATGFAEGDLRGAIVVTFADDETPNSD
jgi:hypothetical protein